jgi:hypothetical protein
MTITMENQVTVSAHNGKGIASFIIGVTCTILLLALIGAAGVMTKAGTLTPEFNIIIGLGMMSVCFVDLIGIALGFFGAVDHSSKKVYPVLGLILNVGILALFVTLLIIGLSMMAH